MPVERQIEVADREIENAEKQLVLYKNEIDWLKGKIEGLQEVNKIVDLEEQVKQNEKKKKELKHEIKLLEKINHEQGNELQRLENGSDHQLILTTLTEKLWVWKDKEQKLTFAITKEEEAVKKQKERTEILQE